MSRDRGVATPWSANRKKARKGRAKEETEKAKGREREETLHMCMLCERRNITHTYIYRYI